LIRKEAMGRISAWFGSLTTGMKALVVLASLVLFAILSPLIALLAALFFIVCIPVVAYRMLRQRPFRRPGMFLLSSLVVLLLASGVSSALYGPSTERASSPPDSQIEPKQEKAQQEPAREEAKSTSPETTAEAATSSREKTKDQAAAKPESKAKPQPEPKPEPQPKPKPKPKPKPTPAKNENPSPYDNRVTVSRVVDGDTIEISPTVNGVEDVRLIGVDTPETVDPSEEVEPYGHKASAFATSKLTGEKVDLEFDVERIDQYDRLLAYVYTTDGVMFNEELVEKGYAQAYPYPPNTAYEVRFEQAQREAKARDLGIWGLSLEQQCLLADRGNGIGEGSIKCDLMAEESASASASPSASADSSATAQPSGSGAVAPISEDDCPQSAPIKGNQSGLYHVPGGAYYDVTNPEECFATAADAEAAGYEASSR
jgi:micrococcal nuclease